MSQERDVWGCCEAMGPGPGLFSSGGKTQNLKIPHPLLINFTTKLLICTSWSCLYSWSLLYRLLQHDIHGVSWAHSVIIIWKPPSASACTSHYTWLFTCLLERHVSTTYTFLPSQCFALICWDATVVHLQGLLTYSFRAQADISGWNRKNVNFVRFLPFSSYAAMIA